MTKRDATATTVRAIAPATPTGTTPTALEWACFFFAHPDEHARLVELDVAAGNAPMDELPTGTRTTAVHWARYLDMHRELLAELGTPTLHPEPRVYVGDRVLRRIY
jgi:hypothetical protein